MIESTRTATRPELVYGVPVMTNSVVPKKTRADAVRRTPLEVVRTTGSRTVTPLTVCGNDDDAAFVSSASVTTSVNDVCGAIVALALADGVGVTERVGVVLPGVAVGDGKTTRDGTQSRVTTITTRRTSAKNPSRATAPTPLAVAAQVSPEPEPVDRTTDRGREQRDEVDVAAVLG